MPFPWNYSDEKKKMLFLQRIHKVGSNRRWGQVGPPGPPPQEGYKNFKRPKNREDNSDLDDFMMETTAATRSTISKKNPASVVQKLHGNLENFRETLVAAAGSVVWRSR